ncbi:nicotinate-nucleotide--dimethylbenzimidazole phosphoribosyltransferase [Corynebacterium uberis]
MDAGDVAELFGPVEAVDIQSRSEAVRLLNTPTSPVSPLRREQLGRLADVLGFLAATQATVSPSPLRDPRVLAVHAPAGYSEASAADVEGGADPLAAFIAGSEATVQPVPLTEGPEQTTWAVAAGIAAVDSAVDSGCDLIIPTVSPLCVDEADALTLFGALTRTEPVALVGFAHNDATRWRADVARVRDGMFRARDLSSEPLEALLACAPAALQCLVGIIAQAAVRRTPVIIDGLVEAAAAWCAEALAQGTRHWLLAGVLTPQPAHRLVLARLGIKALYAMNLPLGGGCGALTTLGMVQATARLAAPTPADEEPADVEPADPS